MTLRAAVVDELMRLLVSRHSLDEVFAAFGEGAAKLVTFDALGVSLLDAERGEFEIVDVMARTLPDGPRRDARMPLAETLLARVVASGAPLRVDDLARAGAPAASRRARPTARP